ncbi:MAG: CpsD/CapB family tyrosine-protein kinase [bacterium]
MPGLDVDKAAIGSGGRGGSMEMVPDELTRYYKRVIGQIENALPRQDSRVLMLSSSVLGEGTTDVVVGLGLTVANKVGKKTLILDCNMHHPEVHIRFGQPDVGLGEVLAGRVPVDQAMSNTIVPNLWTMPLGRGVSSLAAFGDERLVKLIAELRSNFEYVLIDAAPVGAYPECVVLSNKVDGVILVVKYGSTRREIVKRAKEIITRADGRVLGVILNRRKFPIPEFLYRKI